MNLKQMKVGQVVITAKESEATISFGKVAHPESTDTIKTDKAHGVGAYLEGVVKETSKSILTYCKTPDLSTRWWMLDDIKTDSITIEVLQGNKAVIERLVTKELEHFDTKVIWK